MAPDYWTPALYFMDNTCCILSLESVARLHSLLYKVATLSCIVCVRCYAVKNSTSSRHGNVLREPPPQNPVVTVGGLSGSAEEIEAE